LLVYIFSFFVNKFINDLIIVNTDLRMFVCLF